MTTGPMTNDDAAQRLPHHEIYKSARYATLRLAREMPNQQGSRVCTESSSTVVDAIVHFQSLHCAVSNKAQT
jgi:hypothetical protein